MIKLIISYTASVIVFALIVLLGLLCIFGTLAAVITLIDPILIELLGEDVAHTLVLSVIIFWMIYKFRNYR